MSEQQRAERLDQYLDLLLAGRPVDPESIDDGELRSLYSVVLSLRRSREPVAVPRAELSRLAAQLAAEMRTHGPGTDTAVMDADHQHVVEGPAGEYGISGRRAGDGRRARWIVEALAAVVVLALFTGLFVLLLSGRAARQPAAAPSPTLAVPASPVAQQPLDLPAVPVSPPYPVLGSAVTDGTYVVWVAPLDAELTRFELQAARLGHGEAFTVVTGLTHPGRISIDRGIVVWDEADPTCPTGCPRVRAVDLATGETFLVADSDGGVHDEAPAISGDWVVWLRIDPVTGDQAVMARDIATMADPIVLSARTSAQREFHWPVIDGEWVVWAEGDDDAPRHPLMVTRIGSGDVETLVPDVRPFAYALDGGVLVYIERVLADAQAGSPTPTGTGQPVNETLVARRLDTGESWAIRGPLPVGSFHASAPVTDGRFVFWVEWGGQAGAPVGLWGYDLTSQRSAFVVVADGINAFPDVAGGWLVWTRRPVPDQQTSWIYAVRLDDVVASRLRP